MCLTLRIFEYPFENSADSANWGAKIHLKFTTCTISKVRNFLLRTRNGKQYHTTT